MQVTNVTFLLLLPLVAVLLAMVAPARRRALMLLASYAFYAITSAPYLPLLVGVGVVAQQVGRWAIDGSAEARARRAYAAVGFLVVLLIVVRTPTVALFISKSCQLLGNGPLPRLLSAAAPLGFSFYVFEAIGYLVEVAKGREKAYGFWDFQLFVAFFPHLLSGPIMRAKDLVGQFHHADGLRPREISRAVVLVLWGLFLKLALSDQLAPYLDPFFDGPSVALSPADALVVSLGFGVQMYLDFLGYSLVALGAGLLCGATLVENFKHPFNSVSPAEFWNRWHISLSRWIRDYVFLSAVGRSRSLLRMSGAALLAMALCGLWHQWSIKFLVWGLFHGSIVAVYQLYRSVVGGRIARAVAESGAMKQRAYDLLGWAATTLVLLPGWVLFRSPTFERASALLRSFVAFDRARSVDGAVVTRVLCLYALILAAPLFSPIWAAVRAWEGRGGSSARLSIAVARGLLLGIVMASILVYWGGHSGFISLQF